jgi:N-acetylglucosamine-6-phosphate deacetylase
MAFAIRCEAVFDGRALLKGACVVVDKNRIVAVVPANQALPENMTVQDLGEGYLIPGLVDLQVNGGGGVMVGEGCTAATLAKICAAHARLGSTSILPTLISDTPETTAAVIEAAIEAAQARIPGFLGLHLEGPHLDPRRAGAHDPALIRPMDTADLALLEHAARRLPILMVTLAPEAVSHAQIDRLSQAGVIVSLGHTECSDIDARAACAAGAKVVTHLFNAMSQMDKRNPGLVGATLDSDVAAGLIADGIHVADTALRVAMRAKDPDKLFLVSDAMSCAGTSKTQFKLGDRTVWRRKGALRLEDGTLAGADISLVQAMAYLVNIGTPPARAFAMATRGPARVVGADQCGRMAAGGSADLIHLTRDMRLTQVWQRGEVLAVAD